MRRFACVLAFLLVCPMALAQHFHHGATAAPGRISPCTKYLSFAPAVLQPKFQKVDWPVTTGKPDARLYFNQGMTQYYGFNFEEALRNFLGAKKADPTMAMASWGIALAAGPNINLAVDDECRAVAQAESKRARDLMMTGSSVTEVERGLIEALPLRYGKPEELASEAVDYSVAMAKVWDKAQKGSSPQVLTNVGALYAESLLELRPWALFDVCQRPALDTDLIESVLMEAKAVENAVGANHFWIHTVEASNSPARALASANLFRDGLVAASGHLVHMPSHIYLLLGDYKQAVDSNINAVVADVSEYALPCGGSYAQYSTNDKCPQLYYGHYLSHNYFFGAVAATFSGQSERAVTLACDTRAHAQRFVANEPGLQRYMTAPFMALVMNRRWDTILNKDEEPEPPAKCYMDQFPGDGCHILRSMWFWARGMADATKGQVVPAETEYAAMNNEMKMIAPPTPIGWGNNSATAVLSIGQSILKARLTWASGQCKAGEKRETCENAIERAIAHLKLAVTHEDNLVYDEPPQWFPPAREALGGAYLQAKKFKEAELTFDEELRIHKASGRALYGRMRALQEQGQSAKASTAATDFCTAWVNADYTMTDEDLWPAGTLDSKIVVTTCGKPKKEPSRNTCNTRTLMQPTSGR